MADTSMRIAGGSSAGLPQGTGLPQGKKSAAGWLMYFAGKHKIMYSASVFTALLGVLCGLAPYFIMGTMVAELLRGNRNYPYYLAMCLWMLALWLCRVIFHEISTGLSHTATFSVLAEIRQELCDKLYRLPLGFVVERSSGELKSTIVERVDSIETALAHILPEFTANLAGPLCVVIYIFTLDWRMGLASLLTIPVGAVAYVTMMSGYEEKYNNTIVKTKALNDIAVEYINGVQVIKAFGKVRSSYSKFVRAAREGADCFVDWMRSCITSSNIFHVALPATLIGILPIGGLLYRTGTLPASVFILIIIMSFGIITPIMVCVAHLEDIAKVGTITGEVADILEQPELQRPIELDKDVKEKLKDASVSIEHVHFSYNDCEVLHDVSARMPQGSVNALVGPSGSGKSTIAKLIAGLWDVKDGSVKVGGADIRDIPLNDYNRLIAYVSQDNYLFNMSVRENLRLGDPAASDERIEQITRLCGCHDFIMGLEDGYDTVVGDAGGHLSGGERQRIAIARAMLKDAPIVILDEATAYTDPENEAVIQAALARLVHGKTVIMIAHRLSTVMNADQIFVVEGGRIRAQGTHSELLVDDSLYRAMWQAHISVHDTYDDPSPDGSGASAADTAAVGSLPDAGPSVLEGDKND